MTPSSARSGKHSLAPLVLVLLCCLAPLVAAVVVYLNPQWWPDSGSNYGELVQPQRPVPAPQALPLTTLDGQPFDLRSLQGKWLLITVDQAACPESCARKLFIVRNTHASQGKNVDRLKRVWLITDDGQVPDKVLEAYRGTLMLRASPEALQPFLLPKQAGDPAALLGPIWVVDPLGNLMLQFPAQADGVEVRQDISKLLYNSRIG
ncbi:SCO family protein [Bordetella sp. 2513F-2]